MLNSFDIFLTKLMVAAFFYPKTLLCAIVFFVGLLGGLGYLYGRERRAKIKIKERCDFFKSALESFPDGCFLWFYDSLGLLRTTYCSARLAVMLNLKNGKQSDFDEILEYFPLEESSALIDALAAGRRDIEPFCLQLENHGAAKSFLLSWTRAANMTDKSFADILWFRDVTDSRNKINDMSTLLEETKRENALLSEMFESLPFPLWLRDELLQIKMCNQAYATAVHADSARQAILSGSELVYEKSPREAKVLAASARASGKERNAREFVVMDGKRRWVEAAEIPLPSNKTVGFVRDVTRERELEDSLKSHIESNNGVLEHLKTAIAVFDEEMRLQFYNTSFLNLWDLEEAWLDASPTYSHFLDALREKRKLPENRDFAAYKARELKYFTSLVSATEDILHLPSGMTLRRMMTPHPQGGLLITYEDVTGHLSMERSVTVLNETQYTIINHLREAVLLFGRDGRLRVANTAYLNLWEIDENDFNVPPLTVTEVIEKQRSFFKCESNWETLKEQLCGVITSHTGEIFQILRPDGKALEFVATGLSDGGIFVSFTDVTEEEQKTTLANRKESLLNKFRQTSAQADLLRSAVLKQIEDEISPQLDFLNENARKLLQTKTQHLNRTQRRQIQSIADASSEIGTLLKDMADLALIETGSAVLELDSVDVSAVLKSVLNALKERAKSKNITLKCEFPPSLPPLIADKKRLKQIVYYVLNNAVSNTIENGTVLLQARQIENELTICISENASGIKNENDSTATKNEAGFAGALIRNLIEMHGGRILISDKNGTKKTQIFLPSHQKI